jgi:hypothetical protein
MWFTLAPAGLMFSTPNKAQELGIINIILPIKP